MVNIKIELEDGELIDISEIEEIESETKEKSAYFTTDDFEYEIDGLDVRLLREIHAAFGAYMGDISEEEDRQLSELMGDGDDTAFVPIPDLPF